MLCHQPLDAEAKARLGGFERFIRDDTEQQADAAEKDYTNALREFRKR